MDALTLDDVSFVGSGLQRPECVLCTHRGDLFAADRRGGILHVLSTGVHRLYSGTTHDLDEPLLPNGFAMDRDGSFIVAHITDGDGGVFRLTRSGTLLPMLREAEGETLRSTNFVLLDEHARLWITVSTRQVPRDLAFRPGIDDGYIVLVDAHGSRIVADSLGFANELRIDAKGEWLYVNETYSRRLTRFRIATSGDLTNRETFATFGYGTYPDGLAFDTSGALLVTSIVSNRLIHVGPQRTQTILLEDCDPAHVASVERAYLAGTMRREHVAGPGGRKLAGLSSIAFGGTDLRTAYLGVLSGDRLPSIRVPCPGQAMVHWHWP
jgi:sugar lactone lactonase YvrE